MATPGTGKHLHYTLKDRLGGYGFSGYFVEGFVFVAYPSDAIASGMLVFERLRIGGFRSRMRPKRLHRAELVATIDLTSESDLNTVWGCLSAGTNILEERKQRYTEWILNIREG
jgi:hypothetical protein